MCLGETATLSVSGLNLLNYSWTSNNITINSSQAIVSPNGTTNYSLTATDVLGCSSSTVLTQVVSACTGLNEAISSEVMRFYPNPTNGIIQATQVPTGSIVKVADISGRVLSSLVVINADLELDLSDFKSGIYFITVESASAIKTMKILRN